MNMRVRLVTSTFFAAALLCTSGPADAQHEQYIGPRNLYPPVNHFTTHKDIPVVMRDAIQAVAIGTRLMAPQARIMGGDISPYGVYPWAVSIGLKGVQPRDGHFCAGAFIAPDWVLTAAHCVRPDSADKIQLYYNNYLDGGGKVYAVDRVAMHEAYNEETQQNDIALLHVTERHAGEVLRVIPPNEVTRLAPVGVLGVVVGWGLAAEGLRAHNAQRRVTLQVVSNQTCNGLASYPGVVSDSMLCAGFAEGGKGSCMGDGGSPLVVGDGTGNRYLIGISSWGEGCLRPNKFGVYTRVVNYEAWIKETIGGRVPVADNRTTPSTRAAPLIPPNFVGPVLPQPNPNGAPANAPTVRSVVREPRPRSRNGIGDQLNARLQQLGPRSLYPRIARDTSDVPLPILDAQQFIATGRRLLAVKPRIVGGEQAPEGAYPWTASLELKNARTVDAHFCGGAFIAADWVLTAAHCVRPQSAGSVEVLGGSRNLDRGGKLYPVDRIIVHERYDTGTQDYDVALVHLSARYDGPTIRPITAAQTDLASPGRIATVAGWGLLAENASVADILRRVDVQIVSPQACNAPAAYGNSVNGDLSLCAGFATGGKDACQGDSGGPLIVPDRSGGFVQAGIVSWGEGCARPNKYGVYTRVSAVEPWIAEHTGVRSAPLASGPAPRAAPSTRSAPAQTRSRATEDVAPLPRGGVRSNSRVELPNSLPSHLSAQAKTAKARASSPAKKTHRVAPRAAASRADAGPVTAARNPRAMSPAQMP
jgi:secreted trypsin-like serine protease